MNKCTQILNAFFKNYIRNLFTALQKTVIGKICPYGTNVHYPTVSFIIKFSVPAK